MCFTGPRLTAPRTAGSCARATRRRHLRRRRSGCLYLRHGKPPPPSLSPDAQAPSLSPHTSSRRLLGVARLAAWPVAQPAPNRYRSYLLAPSPQVVGRGPGELRGGRQGGRAAKQAHAPPRPPPLDCACCVCVHVALRACACVALRACVRAYVASTTSTLAEPLPPYPHRTLSCCLGLR